MTKIQLLTGFLAKGSFEIALAYKGAYGLTTLMTKHYIDIAFTDLETRRFVFDNENINDPGVTGTIADLEFGRADFLAVIKWQDYDCDDEENFPTDGGWYLFDYDRVEYRVDHFQFGDPGHIATRIARLPDPEHWTPD